jgi:hypothetical protein
VAYYDSFDTTGWGEAGGTSVAASVVAGIYALAPTAPSCGSTPAKPGVITGSSTNGLWINAYSGGASQT